MDTLRDKMYLEELLEQGKAPWKVMELNKGQVNQVFGKIKKFF